MFKYIGIRGHRGAGKQTVAYLLGVTIDYYLNNNKSFEGFDEVFTKAVDRIHEDENFITESDFRRVYFEGFADNPKIMLAQLIGVPVEWTWDDWKKDSVFINMKDFNTHMCKDKLEMYHWRSRSVSAHELTEIRLKEDDEAVYKNATWISLRELIIYFGKYTMQRMFGKNVWVKSLMASELDRERFYSENKIIYKIFIDVKFPTEISYIYSKYGKIVQVERPDNVKDNSEISDELERDNRYDYNIVINNGDLLSLKHNFESIAVSVINA